MIKLLSISGSPIEKSSTDFLLAEIADTIINTIKQQQPIRTTTVRLNELKFIPCQACGKSPEPEYCLYDDGLTAVYRALTECDGLIIGSPIYFDSVSAQTKMFIDRCNCLRPPDYGNINPDHKFIRRLNRLRPAAMVLVGGERGWFEGARRVMAGFFKWVHLVNEGSIVYKSPDFTRSATAREDNEIIKQAHELGQHLAARMIEGYRDSSQ